MFVTLFCHLCLWHHCQDINNKRQLLQYVIWHCLFFSSAMLVWNCCRNTCTNWRCLISVRPPSQTKDCAVLQVPGRGSVQYPFVLSLSLGTIFPGQYPASLYQTIINQMRRPCKTSCTLDCLISCHFWHHNSCCPAQWGCCKDHKDTIVNNNLSAPVLHVCMHSCNCVCLHVCIRVFVCIKKTVYACMHSCGYVCVYWSFSVVVF